MFAVVCSRCRQSKSGNFTSLLRQKAYLSACRTIILPQSTNRNIINLRRWRCPRRELSSQLNRLE